MVNTSSSALVPGREPKPQMVHFTKARKALFKYGNKVHTTLDIKVRISLWLNSELYEYASSADVRSYVPGNAGSATSLRAWTPEDFEPIPREITAIYTDHGGIPTVDDNELYEIARQVRGIVKQNRPGLTDTAGDQPGGPNDTGSAPTTRTRPTSVVLAKRPPTTPEPEASSETASLDTSSPRRQLRRRRRLGPATTDKDLGKGPESPPSWPRRLCLLFGSSLAVRSSTGDASGSMRTASKRRLRRHTPY